MAPVGSPPRFAQLEQAALHVLRLIGDTPRLEETRLAVIGDLALCQYLPEEHGNVTSIDFVVSKSSSPGRVRKEVAGHPMSPLVERSGALYFQLPSEKEIEVKIIPDWLCPYLPTAARPAKDDVKMLPYISLEDLIVFKADACGLRESDSSKRRDACEAAALLELASKHSPLKLDDCKSERLEQALSDIVEFSSPEHDKSWWQRRLGMVPDKQRSAHEIFSELADHSVSSTPPTSPGASSSRSSIYSTMSRTSSSTSTGTTHTMASSVSSIASMDERTAEKNGRPRKMSTTKSPRHKRYTSSGAVPKPALDGMMQRLELGRPASPGVSFTNGI